MSGFNRRNFIKLSAGAGGGLCIGFSLQGCASDTPAPTSKNSFRPDAVIEVNADSRVTLTLARVEMGQGTMTGISTLVAEEMRIDPKKIDIVFAPAAAPYVNEEYGLQITGGSTSLSSSWQSVRQGAATARVALELAAADLWEVKPGSVVCQDGLCRHPDKNTSLTIGQLAGLAANRSLPDHAPLRDSKDFTRIGKSTRRPDAEDKTFGEARYGIDVELEGMVYGYILRPPMIRGKLVSFTADNANSMPGVIKIAAVPRGVAVIASSWWQAKQASGQIEAVWQPDETIGEPDTADVFELYASSIDSDSFDRVREEGDFEGLELNDDNDVTAEYRAPFLAHATLEPQNCVAWTRNGKCDIWAPTQSPDIARFVAQRETGLHRDDVTVHQTYIGGGFGRRLSQDYVSDAAAVSTLTDKPVKVLWTREDDTRHDIYRPASLHRLRAVRSPGKGFDGWHHRIAAPKVIVHYIEDAAGVQLPGFAGGTMASIVASIGRLVTPDISAYEGADEVPYGFKHISVDHHTADSGIPVTYWRAVGHSFNGFVVESFIDELAHASNEDPYLFRKRMLADKPRHLAVLEKVVAMANWSWDSESKRSVAPGKYSGPERVQGLAVHQSFGTYVAQIVELELGGSGAPDHPDEYRVVKVYCAVDCGIAVNPNIVRMQMESGIIFGITAARYGRIDLEKGRVKQSNFHDYRLLSMGESPEIEVSIIDSQESPSGVGEPGLPPVAAAIGNALFSATGQRLRELPLKLQGTKA